MWKREGMGQVVAAGVFLLAVLAALWALAERGAR